jgi:protein-S-isoprenylcysteine O-methyltransferase Ste14
LIYALLLLPPLLVIWAWATRDLISPATKLPPLVGAAIGAIGLGFMLAGIQALWARGRGLPRYITPPVNYVDQAIYKIVPHPIYSGMALLCGGLAIFMQSSSGLWLVTPMVSLALAALVLGQERHELREQFGIRTAIHCIIPPPGSQPPRGRNRIFAFTCMMIPWMFLYEAVIMLGEPHDIIRTHFPFEHAFPVIEWTELIYATPYVITCLLPLIVKTRDQLRLFMQRGLVTMATVYPFYLAVPLVSPHRSFIPETALGKLLIAERKLDGAGAAFPSYHVLWSLIAADVLIVIWPRWKWLWRVWPVLVGVSCVTTGSHGIVDVLAAFGAYWLIKQIPASWWGRKPLILIWSVVVAIAVVRLSMIGADPRLTVGVGLMLAGAGVFVDRKAWAGCALAAAGVAATML